MQEWLVEHSSGSAHDFHHRDLGAVERPSIWIHRVERPALVLGSSQPDELVDRDIAARLDVEVCRRRSGGGLVLVDPALGCWIDVIVTPGSRHWDDDVNRSFLWVGHVWAAALRSMGQSGLTVHEGPLLHRDAGRFLCFAGIGPGEVLQHAPTGDTATGGPSRGDPSGNGAAHPDATTWKVVGLSQRRRRDAARIQGLFVASTDLDLTRRLVRDGAWPMEIDPDSLRIGLAPTVGNEPDPVHRTPRPTVVDPDLLAQRFVALLPVP